MNYPTWAVKLWLDNEESYYRDVMSHLATEPTAYDLAAWLKEYVTEFVIGSGLPSSGMEADLFGWALQSVEWQEIAESYLADYDPEDN